MIPSAIELHRWPLVLAGPVVRRVEPDAASIWVALRSPAEVRVRVRALAGPEVVAEGALRTVPIGEHLHVATVTAAASSPLERGRIYRYDCSFDVGGQAYDSLFAAGVVAWSEGEARALLTYPGGPPEPSFAVPPAEVEDLRLVHGSCRRPNQGGVDAMPALDDIIGRVAGVAARRPHLFISTGDFIYSDSFDWPVAFQRLVSDTASALLGWDELLPGVEAPVSKLPLDRRDQCNLEHLGVPEPKSLQLYSLGEFLAMQLLVMSPTLWPVDFPRSPETRAIMEIRRGLERVRRALANISVLIVFDDHEITDDWNLVADWCQRVYDKPLGRRMVLNGLLAFALIHGWGNAPAAYAGDDSSPGRRLLELARAWRPIGPGSGGAEAALCWLLHVPQSGDALRAYGTPPRLWHRDGGLEWHFRLRAPGYEIVFLDLRTWRAFPGATELSTPDLLSDEALDAQVPAGDAAYPVTLVVSSIPVIREPRTRLLDWKERLTGRLRGALGMLRGRISSRQAEVYYPDLGDVWSQDSRSFAALLARLAPRGRVVCLSGDIHNSFAARLAYAGGARAVFAQLTSSGLLNEEDDSRGYHRYGYNYPWPWRSQLGPVHRTLADGATATIEYVRADAEPEDGREFIGKNNISEVFFARDQGALVVCQRSWWQDEDDPVTVPRSLFTVPLDVPGER